MKKIPSIGIIIFVIVAFIGGWQSVNARPLDPPYREMPAITNKLSTALSADVAALQPGEMTTVIITLRQQANLSQIIGSRQTGRLQAVIQALQAIANASQKRLLGLLVAWQHQGLVEKFDPFWIINGISVRGTKEVINQLALDQDVFSITPDDIQVIPASAPAEFNISQVNAPALWNLGYYGQGVVVANMDTGVDLNHPDLTNQWRGGTNSWYDPYGQHSSPVDLSGHGTSTMGVMVGGDAGGTSIGLAPQAQWIAVKIFNDAGSSTATAIHLGFQWLLDPDGNPVTADAPQVVNNSWTFNTPGCNLSFQLDLQALRAAGILPVFAAGNFGPGSNTSASPANYPEAFAVGAVDNNEQIYSYSSRGPSACGEGSTVYPDLVAPGVNIRTSDRFGLYSSISGTSLASPHVAGALALLLSAFPDLNVETQAAALLFSAVNLGIAGPDNIFGYGRLDVLSAYNWLSVGNRVTPTIVPSPTSTLTPLSTATNTATPTFTATPIPSATFTPIPAATLHVGDLDGSATISGSKWSASVRVYVHNASEGLVANAKVYGAWSNGTSGTTSCTTNSSGYCVISKSGLSSRTLGVKLTITNITVTGFTYTAIANHDFDGDSNGTSIIINKP